MAIKKHYNKKIIILQWVIITGLLLYIILRCGFGFKPYDIDSTHGFESKILMDHFKYRNDSLARIIEGFRIDNAIPPFLNHAQIESLQKSGLADPVEDIRNSLINDAYLIKAVPVLGGNMGFYFRDAIHILNERWVFAYFEDGHISGALILQYDIEKNGKIKWKVIGETIY